MGVPIRIGRRGPAADDSRYVDIDPAFPFIKHALDCQVLSEITNCYESNLPIDFSHPRLKPILIYKKPECSVARFAKLRNKFSVHLDLAPPVFAGSFPHCC